MPETPTLALPYPAPTDPADVPTDMRLLAEAVEAAMAAAGVPPRIGAAALPITDWNAALENGWYYRAAGAGGNSPVPVGMASLGYVVNVGAGNLTQHVWEFVPGAGTASVHYERHQVGGTWRAWLAMGGASAGSAGYGTTLPASPVDGQEYTLVDSLTAPTYAWRFRYSTAISDAHKWVYIGGAPASSEVAAQETTNSGSYVALTTAGPSFTVPRAGIYELQHGMTFYNVSNLNRGAMTLKLAAAAANDAEWVLCGSDTVDARASNARIQRKTLAAADLIAAQYRLVSGTGYSGFRERWLKVSPVRVT